MKRYFFALLALAILVVMFFISLYLQSKVPEDKIKTPARQEDTSSTNTVKDEEAIRTQDYEYKFVPNTNFQSGTKIPFDGQSYDGKIVYVDLKTNQERVVTPSIKDAFPPIKASINYSLLPMDIEGFNPDYIYFNEIAYETDGGLGKIIRFDGKTNTIKELKISDYYS